MRSVNIAELKNKLSAYVTYAKAGETVVIRDRNRSVAMLVSFVAEGADEREADLVARGVMRMPIKETNWEEFLKLPMAQLTDPSSGMTLTQALLDEREEGY